MKLLAILAAVLVALVVGAMAMRPKRPKARPRPVAVPDEPTTGDPRVAATGIVFAIAALDQPLTRAELSAMAEAAAGVFETDGRETAEIVAAGRWEAARAPEPEIAIQRLAAIIRAEAGPDVLTDLEGMIRTVATADGGEIDEEAEALIAKLREALSV